MSIHTEELTENIIDVRINTASRSEIETHLRECSPSFNPPLDSYVNILEYSEKIRENATTIEIWKEETLAGLLAIYLNDSDSKRGYVTNVSVLPEFQRYGFGKVLLNKMLDCTREKKFNEILLEVKKNNLRAIEIYKKFGFEKTDSTKDSYYMIYYLDKE